MPSQQHASDRHELGTITGGSTVTDRPATRPLLAHGLREARRLLEEFQSEYLRHDVHNSDPASVLRQLKPPHQLLLEAIRRTEKIASDTSGNAIEEEGLFFRGAEMETRFATLENLDPVTVHPDTLSEATGAYLGTANRLLDALVLTFLHDKEEIALAHVRQEKRLDEGLSVRRKFADFRIALEQGRVRERPQDRLHSAVSALSVLLQSEIRHWLRASDRNVFRALEYRLQEALSETTADGQAAAEAIYSDLISTTSVLSAINHREELRNRDLRLAYQLPDTLLGPATDDLTETLWEFYGVCSPLDTVLAEQGEVRNHHLRALRAELNLP